MPSPVHRQKVPHVRWRDLQEATSDTAVATREFRHEARASVRAMPMFASRVTEACLLFATHVTASEVPPYLIAQSCARRAMSSSQGSARLFRGGARAMPPRRTSASVAGAYARRFERLPCRSAAETMSSSMNCCFCSRTQHPAGMRSIRQHPYIIYICSPCSLYPAMFQHKHVHKIRVFSRQSHQVYTWKPVSVHTSQESAHKVLRLLCQRPVPC